MAKTIINKHIDNSSRIKRELFNDELSKAKGEIIINNDPDNPSIYIVNNLNEVVKVSGSNNNPGASDFDDTKLWEQINKNTDDIKELQENSYDDSEVLSKIEENANLIDATNEVVSTIATSVNELQESILINSNNIIALQNTVENFECEEYDDTELREMINTNTEEIENLKTLETDSVLTTDITVAGLTGQFGAGNYSNNDIIPSGTTFTEILLNLLCKELYPTNVECVEGSAKVYLNDLTLGLDYSGTCEVGTLITLTSGNTNGVYFDIKNSKISNIEYGYSYDNDNNRVSLDTFIEKECKVTTIYPQYKITTSITGFDADEFIYTQTLPINVESENAAHLGITELGCLNEGDNIISLTATGPLFYYSAESINQIFYCSNLGNTNENHSGKTNSSYAYMDQPIKNKDGKITGAYKYFLGYSDYQSVNSFNENPDSIRDLTERTGFINMNDTTTIVDTTKIKSNGKSIVIACPIKYKLSTIDDSTGANLLGSFTSRGVIPVTTGKIKTDYNVYLLPISNGTELEFKNVTLTINN